MDTLSHALWGKGLFGYRKYTKFAIFFGLVPDLFSFGIYFLFNLLTSPFNYKMGKPELSELPLWVFTLHSKSIKIFVSQCLLGLFI